MTCDKIHYLPTLRKHNLVCTCRVLCMSKIPTTVWRRSDSDTCVSCDYFCFGREKMSFLFVTIKASAIYDIWIPLHSLISFYSQCMTSHFGCAFSCGRLTWRNNCDYKFKSLCDNTYDVVKMYVIPKNKIKGFWKVNIFYNHYFGVFVFISESLKDILVFNFLICIICPIKILIIKPWFYLW